MNWRMNWYSPTVDEEILHHRDVKNPVNWDKLPTSTGDPRISEPSTVVI